MERLRARYNKSGNYYCTPHILKFRKNNELISEEDIYNLFSGFVRLIKKSVELEIEDRYANKIKNLEIELKKYKT